MEDIKEIINPTNNRKYFINLNIKLGEGSYSKVY